MTRARVVFAAVTILLAIASALLAGCVSANAGSAAGNVSSTDGPGLIAVLCVRCHPSQRFASVHKDRNGWTTTITRMQAHGLQLTDQQRQTIIDYLTKRDGGS